MATKRPGSTPRRRSKKPQRGRKHTPAALVFLAGAAVAALVLFFGYAFYYLPAQKAGRPVFWQSAPVAGKQQPGQTPAQGQAQQPQGQQQPAPQAQGAQQPQPQTRPSGPMLALVIDDLGGSRDQARELLELDLPLTFSILPNLTHTREVAAMAAQARMDVILHQPMEAHGQDPNQPGTLRPGMSAKDVEAILAQHLSQLPQAVGVSNHTGSRATEDPALMAAVAAALKGRGLLFLDSRTSDKSVAARETAKAGVPTLTRAVFLDNDKGQQAALNMLRQAEAEARAKGRAVAIGHPHPETIAALAAWSIRRDRGITLVPLTALLKTD